MAEPLVTMWQLFDELATIDLTVMSTDQLGALAIQLGKGIDRLTAYHGKVVHAADERRAWAGDGARDVEEWLSNKTGTSKGQAKSRKRLGEALEKSKTLDDAVNDGELSAASAEQLHDAGERAWPGIRGPGWWFQEGLASCLLFIATAMIIAAASRTGAHTFFPLSGLLPSTRAQAKTETPLHKAATYLSALMKSLITRLAAFLISRSPL